MSRCEECQCPTHILTYVEEVGLVCDDCRLFFDENPELGEEKGMIEIKKGLPELTPTNSNFRRGRSAADELAKAGPGHHTVTEFPIDGKEDLNSFVGGCQYVCKQHDTLKVVRRTDRNAGIMKVYVINEA